MWTKCSKAAKQAIILSSLWAILSWPLQSLFVRYFMSASASVAGFGAVYSKLVETAGVTGDSLAFRIPVPSFQSEFCIPSSCWQSSADVAFVLVVASICDIYVCHGPG